LDKKIEGGEYIMKETNLKATLPYKSDDDFFNTDECSLSHFLKSSNSLSPSYDTPCLLSFG